MFTFGSKGKASFSGSCPTAKRWTIATFTGGGVYCIGFAVGAVVLKMGFFLPFFYCFVFDPSALYYPFVASRGLLKKNSCVDFLSEKK